MRQRSGKREIITLDMLIYSYYSKICWATGTILQWIADVEWTRIRYSVQYFAVLCSTFHAEDGSRLVYTLAIARYLFQSP